MEHHPCALARVRPVAAATQTPSITASPVDTMPFSGISVFCHRCARLQQHTRGRGRVPGERVVDRAGAAASAPSRLCARRPLHAAPLPQAVCSARRTHWNSAASACSRWCGWRAYTVLRRKRAGPLVSAALRRKPALPPNGNRHRDIPRILLPRRQIRQHGNRANGQIPQMYTQAESAERLGTDAHFFFAALLCALRLEAAPRVRNTSTAEAATKGDHAPASYPPDMVELARALRAAVVIPGFLFLNFRGW